MPRGEQHEYHVQDWHDKFVIRTNLHAANFRIVSVPMARARDTSAWQDVIAHRSDTLLSDCEVFRAHLVVSERALAVRRLRVRAWDSGEEHLIAAEEAGGCQWLGENPSPDTAVLRYHYSSLVTPVTTVDYDLTTRERDVRKVDTPAGGYRREDYACELLFAPARDGARIPVSVLARTDTPRDGSAPLYQYAYGAYGASTDALFSASRLSLVDRGFVYAIAHVRGGQELGRAWYEAGRLGAKPHSFDDFVDVTRWLTAERRVSPHRLFGAGASAGGLLIAAVANRAGELYRGLVAHVPFVDVVTSMQDEALPLTSNEYDEWGDPRQAGDYRAMLAWSPYDNVRAGAYPALYVSAGLWDSQVQYWEPAKWVAKLRAVKTDRNPLLLRIEMQAGHGGKSGRFQRLHELAEEYAFLLDLAASAQNPQPPPRPQDPL